MVTKYHITLGTMATYDLSFASQILLWKTKGHWGVIHISSSINTDSQVVSGIAFISVTNKSRSISFSLYFVSQIVLLKFSHCFSTPGDNFVTDPDSNGASRVTLHNLFLVWPHFWSWTIQRLVCPYLYGWALLSWGVNK